MAMHYLDMLGEMCPHPLYGAQAKMEKLAVGDILIIETDFSRSVRNLLDWADRNGHKYEVEEADKGIWQITIEKC